MSSRNIKLEGNSFPIREFKLKWMVPNPAICMIAKKGSGKSWVVRTILKHFKSIPGGIIIAPTDKMNTFYGDFVPDLYIHYEYRSEIIENLLYRQDKMIDKCKDKIKRGHKVDPRAFLVMDDCLSTKGTWMKDQPILEMLFNGRHYKVMYILTMQFPLGISPELRTNFDYIFLLAEDFVSNQKRIYDHYAGMFPSMKAFRQVFMEITKDFGSMVIANRGARTSFLDKVFYFKAQKEDNDTLGCSQYRWYDRKNYNPDWKNSKHFDVDQFCAEKKNSKIVVSKIN